MKKTSKLLTILIVISMFFIFGCTERKDEPAIEILDGDEETLELETVVMEVASPFTEDHPVHKGLVHANELFLEKTDGRISLVIYPNQSYGAQEDAMVAVRMGDLDITINSPLGVSDVYELAEVIQAPYIFNDYDHWKRYKYSDISILLKENAGEAVGVKFLHECMYGFRHVTANKPLETIEDFSKIKLRVVNWPSYAIAAPVLGATGVPLPIGEVYMALSTGVVDAQENPFTQIKAMAFYEVQDYLILTGHMIAADGITMSLKRWESLSMDDQKLVEEVFMEAMDYVDLLVIENEELLLQELQELGMTVLEPDVNIFRENAEKILQEAKDEEWLDLYNRINSL